MRTVTIFTSAGLASRVKGIGQRVAGPILGMSGLGGANGGAVGQAGKECQGHCRAQIIAKLHFIGKFNRAVFIDHHNRANGVNTFAFLIIIERVSLENPAFKMGFYIAAGNITVMLCIVDQLIGL